MPWNGKTVLNFSAPDGWQWRVNLPVPGYSTNFSVNGEKLATKTPSGFHTVTLPANGKLVVCFDMPIFLESPHEATHKDTLTVIRGPLVYTAESWDNKALIKQSSGFQNLGLPESAVFKEVNMEIGGY
jgi:DUF1680 family protein